MNKRELLLPPDFSEDAWLVEAKGVYWDVPVRTATGIIDVAFFDPVRLAQEIEDDLQRDGVFVELKRVLVVRKLTREAMQDAVNRAPESFFE